jgi:hypothetical protein
MKTLLFIICFLFVNYSFSQNINLKELIDFKTMSCIDIDTFLSVRNFEIFYDFYPSKNKNLIAKRHKLNGEDEFFSFGSNKPYLFPNKASFLYKTSNYKHYLNLLKQFKNFGFIEIKTQDRLVQVGLKLYKKLDLIIETSISNIGLKGVTNEYEFIIWNAFDYYNLH